MENEKDGKNRRQEGRKRSSQLTDNEDDEDVNNIVTVAPASLTAALSSLSNQMEQMEGTMSQINSTLRNFHVDNCDKRIKTELPEFEEEKIEEGTTNTTVGKYGSRDDEENERIFMTKQSGNDQKQERRPKRSMVAQDLAASLTSKRTPDIGYEGVWSACGQSQKIEGKISGSSVGAGGNPFIAIPSTSKGINIDNGKDSRPTADLIPRKLPEQGDFVYAMVKNLENPWLLVRVLENVHNQSTQQREYVIQYEETNKKLEEPCEAEEVPDETIPKTIQVCLKQLASPVHCPYPLVVGSRIIAKLTDTEDQPSESNYYAGIVADRSISKENHYLIFFDVGISQYVHANNVNLTLGSDRWVWNDVHPDCYDFIKKYIIEMPNWPMVTLRIGQILATEWNGMWIPARIRKLDESLAYVQFENDGQCEWIYRGSGRFRPVPNSLLREEQRKLKSGTFKQAERSSSPAAKKMKKARTCSGYSAAEIYKQLLFFTGRGDNQIEDKFRIELDDPTLCVEYQGRLRKVVIPTSSCPKQKLFVEHKCDSFCVLPFAKREEFRKLSPLVIPFYFGWTRHKITELARHEINYKAPCGLTLKDANTLNEFLKLTQSDFCIDHFCFDYDVDCENEFVPARVLLRIEDISENREVMSVQLVNSIDMDEPDKFEYLRESELGPGVIVSEDKGFLICCDCQDGDCSDQENCPCWQMTKEGVDFTHMDDEDYPTQGYEQRKLRDKLLGAIYECNDRCTCKKSCTNRVVQNGGQWPLQVFKTRKKGWGVRTLVDIPSGSFVGFYVGEIFNSDYAEEMGKERGDEYFLQLDYIETYVNAKECYEDIESEDTGEDADDEDDSGDRGKTGPSARRKDDAELKRLKERRKLFGKKEDVYVVDSKKKGSVTRFMNHCCCPNLYPQNVFVKTHDLRFAMVAFFTNKLVKAGSELTWDYNYSVGSVDGTKVYCQCMAYNCKARLL